MDNPTKIPLHVSIIMDGNGRWAQERGRERVYGHLHGIESVRRVTETCVKMGVKYLSLFAFSEENWGRPEAEVGSIMELMMTSISKEYETMMRNGVRFVVIGDRSRLSPLMCSAIDTLMEKTKDNAELTMIVFLSYSGKWDILQAAKKLATEAVEHPEEREELMALSTEGFDGYLATAGYPDPDIIIRTSGEKRISNYLLWQGAYSEFFFVDTLWPDFGEEELRKVLEEYALRDRRYGKVK